MHFSLSVTHRRRAAALLYNVLSLHPVFRILVSISLRSSLSSGVFHMGQHERSNHSRVCTKKAVPKPPWSGGLGFQRTLFVVWTHPDLDMQLFYLLSLITLLFFKTTCKVHLVVCRCLPLMKRSWFRRNNLRILLNHRNMWYLVSQVHQRIFL